MTAAGRYIGEVIEVVAAAEIRVVVVGGNGQILARQIEPATAIHIERAGTAGIRRVAEIQCRQKVEGDVAGTLDAVLFHHRRLARPMLEMTKAFSGRA